MDLPILLRHHKHLPRAFPFALRQLDTRQRLIGRPGRATEGELLSQLNCFTQIVLGLFQPVPFIEKIAEAAGLSRTVLGERFVELMGEPPMRYCARWRMRVAANMLRDGRQNNGVPIPEAVDEIVRVVRERAG